MSYQSPSPNHSQLHKLKPNIFPERTIQEVQKKEKKLKPIRKAPFLSPLTKATT